MSGSDSHPVVTPSGVLGRSRAGSSEILMASFMAASRPWPPSPLKAGPKHSGRLMRSFTTTLAFSSTLSPWDAKRKQGKKTQNKTHKLGLNVAREKEKDKGSWRSRSFKGEAYFFPFTRHTELSGGLTIAEDSEPKEGKVTLSLYGVPAQVWVTFGYQHGTALKATAGQVRHHLNIQAHSILLSPVPNKLIERAQNRTC